MNALRTSFLTLLLSLGWCNLYAQRTEPQFLISEGVTFSGFGGPMYEFSDIDGDFVLSMGGGGALLINQQVFLGGYGMGLVTSIQRPVASEQVSEDMSINFGHGGLWLGYIHQPYQLIHFGFSAKVAGGGIDLQDADHVSLADDAVFVLTLQPEVEVNVLKWFKVNAGIGYRWVTGVNLAGFTNQDFSHMAGSIRLMFGWFDQ